MKSSIALKQKRKSLEFWPWQKADQVSRDLAERVITECDPQAAGVDVALLEHVSPIEWDNVLLYGEYVIDRSLIRAA